MAIRAAVLTPAASAAALDSCTWLTKPAARASAALKSRAVRHSSLTHDRLPTTLGKRASVPMSAASPMSTSLTANRVSLAQMRMSAQHEMSMASPIEMPCRTQMTAG